MAICDFNDPDWHESGVRGTAAPPHDTYDNPIQRVRELFGEKLHNAWDLGIARYYGYPIQCVYFLIYKDQIVYVGQTIDLDSRLNSHAADKKYRRCYDGINYLKVHDDKLNVVELLLIQSLDPWFNERDSPYSLTLDLADVAAAILQCCFRTIGRRDPVAVKQAC